MTKKFKALVSLLLVFCMVFSLTLGASAAEIADASNDGAALSDGITEGYGVDALEANGEEELYKIVHLDCGRKYFTPDQIKTIINTMAAAGFNQLQLYLSDNQGYRLALDDMTVTTEYGKYDLEPALGDGYEQTDKGMYPDGTDRYLTETEMTDIIRYAGNRGIEIVPCINVPGHMGTILKKFPEFCYTDSNENTSESSIDLENEVAVAFALGVTNLYAEYFRAQGCRYYNLGADEYANDICDPNTVGFSVLKSEGKYPEFVEFINQAAKVVIDNNMTPRVFNDGMYYDNDTTYKFDSRIQVCYWSNWLSASASTIAGQGHAMINTNSTYYWVLSSKSGWHCSAELASQFDINSFSGGTIENPAGAMFCIWNDEANYQDSDWVISQTAPTITAFGAALPDTNEAITDEGTGVSVKSSSNLPVVTVTESSHDVEVSDAEEVKAYDVQVTAADDSALNYAVSADISVPVPQGWQDASQKIFAFFVDADGTVTKKWGSYANGSYTFRNVPVPSTLGIALSGDIEVTVEKNIELGLGESVTDIIKGADYSYSRDETNFDSSIAGVEVYGYEASDSRTAEPVTEILSGKSYAIQSKRQSGYMKDVSNSAGMLTLETVAAAAAQAWKITRDGSAYTIQNSEGKYLTIGSATAGLSDTKVTLNITYNNDNSCWEIGTTAGDYFLNNYAKGAQAGGYTSGVSDEGSRWNIYLVTEPREMPETEVVFTGTAIGQTILVVGNTRYHISVYRKVENITLDINETASFRDLSGNYVNSPADGLNQDIATVTMKNSDNEAQCEKVSMITSGRKYLISAKVGDVDYVVKNDNGNASEKWPGDWDKGWDLYGLFLENKDNISDTLENHLWTITEADGGYYVQNAQGSYMTIQGTRASNGNANIKLASDLANVESGYGAVLTVTQGDTFGFSYNGSHMNNFGQNQNCFAAAFTEPTTWTLYEYVAPGDGTDLTFTAVAPGKTSVVIGKTLYNITVNAPDLTIRKYVSSYPVWEADDATKTSVTATASVNDGGDPELQAALLSEEGAALSSIVPEDGKCAYASDTNIQSAVFWKGAVWNSGTGNSTEFSYLRYHGNRWQYSSDRNTWTDVEETDEVKDEVKAYYLINKKVTLNLGESETFNDESGDYADNPKDGLDETIARVSLEKVSQVVSYNQVNAITSGKEYLITLPVGSNTRVVQNNVTQGDNGGWPDTKGLPVRQAEISPSNANLEQYLWKIEKEEGSENDYSVKNQAGYMTLEDVPEDTRGSLELKEEKAVLTVSTNGTGFAFSNNGCYMNNYGGENRFAASWRNGVTYWTLYECQRTESTAITIIGEQMGTTSVIIGDIYYDITVKPADLTIHMFISGNKVWDFTKTNGSDKNPANYETTITVSGNDDTYSDEGVALVDLVPARGDWEWSTDAVKTVFWKGVVLTGDDNWQSGKNGQNLSMSGTEYQYVRCNKENYKWQYSSDRVNWITVTEEDEVEAYYLLRTNLTREVTTYVSDWAFTPSVNTNDESTRYQKALSFAVVYEDGTMNPSETAIYGKSTMIFWDNLKDLGFISVDALEGFEVEKLTYTFGERADQEETEGNYIAGKDIAGHWTSTDSITWEKVEKDGVSWYNETECWNKSAGTEPHILGTDLDEQIYAGIAETQMTGGVQETKYNGSWGYNDAVLVLIYVKPIKNEDTLTVRYWDDSVGTEIYNYMINVQEGNTFLDLQQESPVTTGTFTLDDENSITNIEKVERTVVKDLMKLPALFGKYSSGMYSYVSADLSDDGKTLNLHYNLNNNAQTRRYVVDFGLPVEIPFTDLGQNISSLETESVSSGRVTIDNDAKRFTYTPDSVYTGAVVLKMTACFEETATANESSISYTVGIYPATTVYYEEGFAEFDQNWGENKGSRGTGTQKAESVGSETEKVNVYGYEPAYADNTAASSNDAATTSVKGASAAFNFKGTGIDVYANCSANSGKAIIQIENEDGYTVKLAIVDTKTLSNLYADSSDTEQYGLPILSVNGLAYGNYKVKILNASEKPISFDGFRIYGTLQDQKNIVYTRDHEHEPKFIELRDQVLAALNVSKDSSAETVYSQIYGDKDGAVAEPKVVLIGEGGTSPNAELLLSDGPKNELFLFPNQAVSFKVNTSGEVQIGLKAINGSVNYTITDNGTAVSNSDEAALNSSTDMFYKILEMKDGEPEEHVITIKNTSAASGDSIQVLSVTKLKICGASETAPISALTEGDVATVMAVMRGEYRKAPEKTEPEETESEETRTEETEPEETKPERTESEETKTEGTKAEETKTEAAKTEHSGGSDKTSSIPVNENTGADASKEWQTVTVSGGVYTNLGGNTAAFTAPENKNAVSVKVRKTITVNGVTVRVTKVSANAFKNCRKLKSVTLGGNVTEIGKKAFMNCSNLKKIVISSKALKKVGAKAFKGIHQKAKIKVPSAKMKAYKKLLKGKGQAAGVKIVSKK